MNKSLRNFSLLLGILAMTACHSVPLQISTAPVGPDEEVVGEAFGEATGIMLFQVIPIKQNNRFKTAYNQALQSSGGTRLVNPTINEKWFWAFVLNGYSFSIHGTAVKKK